MTCPDQGLICVIRAGPRPRRVVVEVLTENIDDGSEKTARGLQSADLNKIVRRDERRERQHSDLSIGAQVDLHPIYPKRLNAPIDDNRHLIQI